MQQSRHTADSESRRDGCTGGALPTRRCDLGSSQEGARCGVCFHYHVREAVATCGFYWFGIGGAGSARNHVGQTLLTKWDVTDLALRKRRVSQTAVVVFVRDSGI